VKETLTRDHILAALEKAANDLIAAADELRQLDAAIGDGDLGITVTLGFEAVREQLSSLADSDIATILRSSGLAFNRKAASTFGALYATMMIQAAQAAKGLDAIGLEELAEMVEAAVRGVSDRGKANPGDKTMLDALLPLGEALSAAASQRVPLSVGLSRAASAAEKGMQATVNMKSKTGRASWFADRTVGTQDPGATAVYLMIRSLDEFVASN